MIFIYIYEMAMIWAMSWEFWLLVSKAKLSIFIGTMRS